MPLSRLDNFLKNVRGNIIYVSPNDLDATDSIENRGNSMGRPFLTIQRALLEASRFSYQQGLDNDRYGKTTIHLGPGEHVIDNRPGWIPDGTDNFRLRNGTTSNDFPTLTTASNFDLNTPNNILYKLNSVYGGVIIPRGISLVGTDLRKVKVRPLYVPDPVNDNIGRSSLWKITGGSYFLQVTMFDGDPNGQVYKNYNTDKYVPNYSHHKLTCFEFVDGVNDVDIADTFQTYKTDRTDLEMYYEKVGLLYGTATGRPIEPDYPSSGLDIQPKVDEYRIVGPTGGQIEISSVKSGDGTTGSKIITVVLTEALAGLNVDTAFQIRGVSSDYNGQYVVQEVLTTSNLGTTSFTYQVSNIPAVLQPAVTAAVVELDINTVVGASPYIFNCSFRSVYGMCGVHADGSKTSGFKSMVISQFTGVSLQKDNNAFVRFDSTSGSFKDSSTIDNIHSNASAKYKPAYYNHHIKVSNNAVLQVVSIFAVGFSHHFVADDGGDYSITNSNSNFGQTALYGKGFRNEAFTRDDVGYITNIIPPKENVATDITLEYGAIDVSATVGIASTSRLYLYGETNEASPPPSVLQGYRVGAKSNDKLSVGIGTIAYNARIIMSDTEKNVGVANQISSVKKSIVGRSGGVNDISDSTLTFTANHELANGESIRVVSDNARLPDGLNSNVIYYAITDGLASDKIKIAATPTDATNANGITLNALGGVLTVESRVSDKNAGDIGHPVQYDSGQSQWFVGVATDNEIYPKVIGDGTAGLGNATARTYITRKPDTRGIEDKIYKVRFVVPSSAGITTARAPRENYIMQESSDVTGASNSEVALLYSSDSASTLSNSNQLRNFSFLRDATWATGGTAYFTSEIPHKLNVGSQVKILNVTSGSNLTGIAKSGFNGTFTVAGITSESRFYVTGMSADPGTFTNDTSIRNLSLPTFQRVRSKYNFYVYDSEQLAEYKQGEQDGVYSLTVLDASHTPDVSPFNDSATFSYPAPISNLYPQYDRDNPSSNPSPSISYALPSPLGQVVINEPKNSITRGAIDKVFWDYGVGVGITDIVSQTGTGNTITIYTDVPHGLNRITNMSLTSTVGAGYGTTLGLAQSLYNVSVGLATETDGINATARITVDTSGSVTSLKIMDGGTNYTVGDILSLTGTATTTGFTTATATVTATGNNSGDTLRIAGVTSTNYEGYNQLYRITGITTDKAITAVGVNTISNGSTTGIGVTLLTNAYAQLTGSQLTVVGGSVEYNGTVGILTVVTSQAHGLRVNNNITIGSTDGGNNTDLYNKEMIVTKVNSLTEFEANIGVSTLTPTFTGTIYGYYPGLAAQSGTITPTDEQYGGRVQNIYAGITTTVGGAILATDVAISIDNALNYNFNIGDYLRIDDEILRIKKVVTSTNVSVFRGLYGTKAVAHDDDSVVRRISLPPFELRRPSIMRASSHTFEYLGYGAGNYSTALPQVQSDQPTFEEQVLAQSITSSGGLTVYTGMDSAGDYYVGNKRISASSGKEEVYNSPVPTITGEDVTNPSILTTDNVDASRRIVVDGGTNGDILSEFNGPVLFSKKITSTSDEGIEASSFKIQGDATISRKYTVGIATPTTAGNVGDVVYNSEPVKDGTLGWVYTTDNGWYPFGNISIGKTALEFTFNKLGVGAASYGDNTFQVGSGTSIFSVDAAYGVGIGSTSCNYKLNVNGDSFFNGNIWSPTGIVTALEFHGNGTNLTGLDSIWAENSVSEYIYVKDNTDLKVGIGTSIGVDGSLVVGSRSSAVGLNTALIVHNRSHFIGTADFDYDVNVSGFTSLTDYDLRYSSIGRISAGIITSTDLVVGTSGTVITSDSTNSFIGMGTATPREKIDLSERTRMSSYYEAPYTVTSSSGVVILDLSKAQSFQLTTSEAITQFTVSKAKANMSTTFTIKITQDASTAYTAAWTFKDDDGTTLSVKWPGGVAPTLTSSTSAIDIYSFITMDGGTNLYGVVGGQNFS